MKSAKLLKKIATIAVTTSLVATMFMGCGGNSATSSSSSGKEAAASGEKLEMWTFVELHAKFYEKMLAKWNEKNPDKKLDINFSVLPYDDMHN
jgi:arabinosaccharide transport system substrate-binding protein